MAYVVDRVVICDAYQEPTRHYQLLTGGRSKRVETRRPSMRFLASAKDVGFHRAERNVEHARSLIVR